MTFATEPTGPDHYRDVVPPAPAPRAAGRGDGVRRALLDAAHDLLATEGPASLTVRGIAAAAGMSTMNVYSRFGGKDGVLDQLFADGFRRLGEEMEAAGESDDPLDDLRRCGRSYRQFARENATYYSLMFDRVVPDFEPSEAARAIALGTLGQLQGRVERAMAAGVIRDADPFAVATALWACQHGLASLEARATEGEVFDWDTAAALTTDALLRGFA